MKRCKCGCTKFLLVEKVTCTQYSTVDEDGDPDETRYREDEDYKILCYTCEECRADFDTWNEIPEA